MFTLRYLRSFLMHIIIILAALALMSCAEEDPLSTENDPVLSKEKSTQATGLLENQFYTMIHENYGTLNQFDQVNLSAANTLYKDALTLDATNTDAQFGAALTEFLMVYADPDFNALIKDLDSSFGEGSGFAALTKIALLPAGTKSMKIPVEDAALSASSMFNKVMKDPPLFSRIQTVFRTKVLPRVEYAAAAMAKLESNNAFKFVISGKMQGDPNLQPVALYPAEVYMMDAMLHFLKFYVDFFLIYKFDLPDYSQSSLLSALNQNSTSFFVLAPDGQARATAAKADLTTMVSKLLSGITSLETLSGTKPDAVIRLGNDGIRQRDLDTTKKYLNEFNDALSQTMTVELKDADSEGNDYTIQVNLGAFFTNLPQNPKAAYLPAYTIEPNGPEDISFQWNAQTYAEFTFPDPTFGGVFPGMTNEKMKRLMRIDEDFAFELMGHLRWYYNPGYPDIKLKIYTASASYLITVDEGAEYRLLIRDAGNTPIQITGYAIMYGTEEIEMQMLQSGDVIYIQAKSHNYLEVRAPVVPYNLNGFAQSNPAGVQLSWSMYPDLYWSEFLVYRKTGTGNFELLTPHMGNSYTDFNISSGMNYTYMVSSNTDRWYYGYPALVPVHEITTNEVTITP